MLKLLQVALLALFLCAPIWAQSDSQRSRTAAPNPTYEKDRAWTGAPPERSDRASHELTAPASVEPRDFTSSEVLPAPDLSGVGDTRHYLAGTVASLAVLFGLFAVVWSYHGREGRRAPAF